MCECECNEYIYLWIHSQTGQQTQTTQANKEKPGDDDRSAEQVELNIHVSQPNEMTLNGTFDNRIDCAKHCVALSAFDPKMPIPNVRMFTFN